MLKSFRLFNWFYLRSPLGQSCGDLLGFSSTWIYLKEKQKTYNIQLELSLLYVECLLLILFIKLDYIAIPRNSYEMGSAEAGQWVLPTEL